MSATTHRHALFVECRKCGERWKVATLPMDVLEFTKVAKRRGQCPNCGEKREVSPCPTDGPNAVREARNGSTGP